jgi:hypothetical protein
MKKKKSQKIPKPRNEFAVAARFRTSAGPMEQSRKAKRRDAKVSLKKSGGTVDYLENELMTFSK